MKREYQYNYSELNKFRNEAVYNKHKRLAKAKKIILVLKDFNGGSLKELNCLEIGCSTGIMSDYIANHFKSYIGIDIEWETD